MKVTLYIFISVVSLLSCRLMANPEWMWAQHYESQNIDALTTVTDSYGNYYTAYMYRHYPTYGKLMKTNLYGDLIWSKDLIYPDLQISILPYKMHMDRFNNIYIFGTNNNYMCLTKLNLDGEILWIRNALGTVSVDVTEFSALTTDIEGNPIMVFINFSSSSLWGNNRRIVKFSSSGDLQDSEDAGIISMGERSLGISCDSSGYIYMLYRLAYSSNGNGYKFYLRKYDQDLEIVQTVELLYFTFNEGYPILSSSAIKVMDDNSIVISGYTDRAYYVGGLYFPSGGWFTAKLNPDFTFQWVVPYGGSSLEIDQTDCIILGHSLSSNAKVTKLNTAGTLLHSNSLSLTPFSNWSSSIAVDINGDCVMSGVNGGGIIQGDNLLLQTGGPGLFLAKIGEPHGTLSLNPSTLDLGSSSPGYQSNPQEIVLSNFGTGDLQISGFTYSINPDIWQVTLPSGIITPFIIEPRDTVIVSLSFTPQAVMAYQDTLHIVFGADNSGEEIVRIQGQGVYAFPAQVQNVSIAHDGFDILVQWDPTTSSIYNTPLEADYYFIYGSNYPNPTPDQQIFIGYSASTSFRHVGVGLPGYNIQGPRMYFYQVTAVVIYQDRDLSQKLDALVGRTKLEVLNTLR